MTSTIDSSADLTPSSSPTPDTDPVSAVSGIDHDGESQLVRRAQSGDLDAFEQLMGLHIRKVRTFLALRVPAPHLIDELTHETFIFAFKRLDDFTAGTAFGAWLRAIANNLLRAEIQRFSREQRHRSRLNEHIMLEMHQAEHATSLLDGQVVDALERSLGHLPPDMQELVDMKYRHGLSAQEIATRTERSVAWVRTTLFRVRQRLRQDIEQILTHGADA